MSEHLAPGDLPDELAEQVREAADILSAGGLVAYPTDTVYGLGADPFNEAGLKRLFRAKGRLGSRPVPLLIAEAEDMHAAAAHCPRGALLLAGRFWPGPLTLVLPARPDLPKAVTGGSGTVGLRVPAHETSRALARALGRPIVGTSANSSGRPPHRTAADVAMDLGARVDLILPGDCPADAPPSTVVNFASRPPRILRAGALSLDELCRLVPEIT